MMGSMNCVMACFVFMVFGSEEPNKTKMSHAAESAAGCKEGIESRVSSLSSPATLAPLHG
jgi:hypothetical protein